ncbi:uracil-DNA glycosylase family protein, partial [Jannaschia donghaensis]|uniref:uracil-DNA glycosylase family protein n=1 Tax=Jannaschia donghaensis TaxID=420998 RepID=UPI0034D19D97
MDITDDLRACRLCADRFAATHTGHQPKPVVWFAPGAPILLASQAPGMRAHKSGKPFDDPSGVRLRDWMGIDEDTFWNKANV